MWTFDDIEAGPRNGVTLALHRAPTPGKAYGTPVIGAIAFMRVGHKAQALIAFLRDGAWRFEIETAGPGLQPLFQDARLDIAYLTGILTPKSAIDLLTEAGFGTDIEGLIENWYALARPKDEVLITLPKR